MYEYHNLAMLKAENPAAYKKLAEEGIMVAHPVSIKGQSTRSDIGIGYHSTVKFFDPSKDHPEAIHDVARGLKMTPPDPHTTGITPSMFKDRFGNDVYVVKLHGEHADQIKENNSKFSHMGHPSTYNFTPHISVDKATWEHIVDSGAKTAHEAGIEFGHAQLKQGHKVLTTYKHGGTSAAAPQPERKLAASEKMSGEYMAKGQRGDWKSEGYKISHSSQDDRPDHKDPKSNSFFVDAHDSSGNRAGRALFIHHTDGGIFPASSKVESDHQRKGLASAMYEHAEKVSGKVLRPESGTLGEGQTNSAVALWSQPNRPFGKSEDLQPLEKGLKQSVTAAAMASMIGLASPTAANPSSEVPQQASYQSKYDSGKMLRTISQVESSGGKFINHRMIGGKEDGDQAFGKYGLMPNTIRETIYMNRDLKSKYGKAANLDGADLHHFMQDNPGLEDQIAQKHLARLEHHFGKDPAALSYSWLEGIKGTYKAKKDNLDFKKHWHVKKALKAYGEQK